MEIKISFQSEIPIYRQIAGEVRERLAAGRLQPGEQLPPVRTVAAQIGVNFNTVARAYRLLDAQGLISTQQGRGTFISLQIPGSDLEESHDRRKKQLTEAYLEEMRRLGSTEEEIGGWINRAARESRAED